MASIIKLDLESLDDDLCHRVRQFAAALLKDLADHELTAEIRSVDHICYRVSDLHRYEHCKRALRSLGTLLSEAFINGRPIAAIKLARGIPLDSTRMIDVLELPAPRADAVYDEGFEHIEVVALDGLEAVIARHPTLKFNCKNLHASVNREITMQFPSGLVKFHECSLEATIRAEQQHISQRAERLAAFLDFDDTLVHSKEPFQRACQAALEETLGRSIAFTEILAKARPTFPEFFSNFGIQTEAEVWEAVVVFQRHWPRFVAECSVPVGIQSLLSCLSSEGVELHVWTARDRKTTVDYLKRAGLSGLIATVSGFGDEGPGKPVPPQALQMLSRRGRVVLIGDSGSDKAAAANLGVPFLQAAWVHSARLGVDAESVCATPLIALTKSIGYLRSAT